MDEVTGAQLIAESLKAQVRMFKNQIMKIITFLTSDYTLTYQRGLH